MLLVRRLSYVLAVLLLTTAGEVSAQDDGGDEFAEETGPTGQQPENMQATQRAREQFVLGADHFRAHRYREAIQAFGVAAQLIPSADLWYNIARSHEELSEYEQAIDFYQRYLRDRVDPPDRVDVERHIENLRQRAEEARALASSQPTSGTLRLSANRDGSSVELDGASVESSPWEAPREVEPGRHQLSVLRDGYVPFRSEVSVEAGVTTAAYADLVAETRYRSVQNDPIAAWIIWGFAAVSLGVTIGLGVEAASRQGSDLDSARTFGAFSDVFLGTTIGLSTLGLIIWFVESASVGTERITVEDEGASDLRGAVTSDVVTTPP